MLNIIVETEQNKVSVNDWYSCSWAYMIIFDLIVNRQKDRQKDWSQSSYRWKALLPHLHWTDILCSVLHYTKYRFLTFSTFLLKAGWKGKGKQWFDLKTEFPQTTCLNFYRLSFYVSELLQTTCLSCDVTIVLSNKGTVIERSIEFDYWSFGNRTFDCVRLAKFYCEFDYVRLSSAIIERLVFDWVRLPNCSRSTQRIRSTKYPQLATLGTRSSACWAGTVFRRENLLGIWRIIDCSWEKNNQNLSAG